MFHIHWTIFFLTRWYLLNHIPPGRSVGEYDEAAAINLFQVYMTLAIHDPPEITDLIMWLSHDINLRYIYMLIIKQDIYEHIYILLPVFHLAFSYIIWLLIYIACPFSALLNFCSCQQHPTYFAANLNILWMMELGTDVLQLNCCARRNKRSSNY